MDFYEALKIAIDLKLHAPDGFAEMKTAEILNLIPHGGGCGPGVIGDVFVPDRILGLNIKPCCLIHDVRCARDEKDIGDIEFLYNMVKMIKLAGGMLKHPRLLLAMTYFDFVDTLG